MALEDGAVLGEVFSRLPKGQRPSVNQVKRALSIYEACRRMRTQNIVQRGYLQQHLYHLNDGEDQQCRDEMMKMVPTRPGEALVWRDPEFGPWLLGYDHVQDVNEHWPEHGLEEQGSTDVHSSIL
jgi:salicylate hydroxylase